MNKNLSITMTVLVVIILGYVFLSYSQPFEPGQLKEQTHQEVVSEALAARFDYLSQNGNSSCSASFRNSIPSMPDDARLQGSCCSLMSMHRYSEQVEGLKKFKTVPEQNISKIPNDPYDLEVGLAKELISYYDLELTPEEQKAYDYALQNSSEKGPCCCKCWRWYVYGGLGKYLIKNHGFTGEQITEVWNLSDGCGGDSEHHH
jgi:hypothetical protein